MADWQSELYNRYHGKVLGICAYFLRDREEAKDACQDVFIKAFKSWKDFQWKCDPLTWIAAIARHDCFTRRLRAKRHSDRRLELAAEEMAERDQEPEADLIFQKLQLERMLPEARGKLREILRLSLEQGLNQREIAAHMGVSRVAITRRLTRFRKELQDCAMSRERRDPQMQSPTRMRAHFPMTRNRTRSSATGLPSLHESGPLIYNWPS